MKIWAIHLQISTSCARLKADDPNIYTGFGKSGAPQSSNKIALTIEEEPEKSVIEQSVSTSDCLSEPDVAHLFKSSKNTEHEN
jgi:hypothetical protein